LKKLSKLFILSFHYPSLRRKRTACRLSLLFAVVCFEVHFLDLAHQRISWVSTGTLVIECILNHAVQSFQEVFLVHTVILDALLDANSLFEIFDLLDEQFESFLVILATYTTEVCTFCIASQ